MIAEIDAKQEVARGKPHRWQPGESGNPKGKVKNPEMEELRQALLAVKKNRKDNKDILHHFVERAYVNDNVLIALMKKFLPDKSSTDIKGEVLGGTKIYLITVDGKPLEHDNRINNSEALPSPVSS